jgi:hypothetical protein
MWLIKKNKKTNFDVAKIDQTVRISIHFLEDLSEGKDLTLGLSL